MRFSIPVLILSLGCATSAALALDLPRIGTPGGAPPDPTAGFTAPQHRLTAAEAARKARDEHGGRVLSVQETPRGYKVKLLREGVVRIVEVED